MKSFVMMGVQVPQPVNVGVLANTSAKIALARLCTVVRALSIVTLIFHYIALRWVRLDNIYSNTYVF